MDDFGTPPAHARASARTPVAAWALLAVIAGGVALGAHLLYGTALSGADIEVYHGGGAAVAHGGSLYGFATSRGLPFTYPPFAALLLVPVGLLPLGVAVPLWAALCALALEATVWITLGAAGMVGGARRAWVTAACTVAGFCLAPVSSNFWTGQINTVLMLLVVADLGRPAGRWRGLGAGVAAGMKLTPLVFVPYLLLRRQGRAAGVAAAGFAGTVLVGLAVLPGASRQYWLHDAWDIRRVIPVDGAWVFNQSILGAFKRVHALPATPLWLALGAVTGAVGLAVAARAGRQGPELAGVVVCAVTGLLVSPVSWPFHWVWCVPLLVLGAARAWRGGRRGEKAGVVALGAGFAAASVWTFSVFFMAPAQPSAVLVAVFSDLFVLIGLALLAVLALRARGAAQVVPGRGPYRARGGRDRVGGHP